MKYDAMTTTQRVDVERLSESIRMIEGCRVFVTTREKIKHPEGTDLFDESVRIIADALTALLRQLAVRDAEVERHKNINQIITVSVCAALSRGGITDCDDPGEAIDVMREQLEQKLSAAEREREGAMGLLREVINNPHADGDALLDSKIAAFLAANGGRSNGP